jgi:hypothetical protein
MIGTMYHMNNDTNNDLRGRVRKFVANKRGAKYQLAKAADVDPSNLTKWLNGSWSFGPDSLARIEHQLSKGKQ